MMKLITFFLLCLMFPSFAEKAEKIDPKAQATRSFRDGLFWLKKQKYEKAQIKFKDAIEKQPKLAEAYNNYAYCTRMISDSDESYEEALKYYGAAIKLKPTLAVAPIPRMSPFPYGESRSSDCGLQEASQT